MTTIRIASNNIWNCDHNLPAWEALGEDCSAATRMQGIARVYDELRPDIVGLQEASHTMLDCLMTELHRRSLPYALSWARFTSILYRADVFELIDSTYLPYPEAVEGFEGSFNDVQSKSLGIAVLRHKADGHVLVIGNTHLWWKSDDPTSKNYQRGSAAARAYQIHLAIERLTAYQQKHGAALSLLMGDLNDNYHSRAVQTAISCGYLHAHDIATEYASPENGYHYCFPDGHKPYIR